MNERKYRVNELLERMPFNEVALAKKFLINQLKITEKTFSRYQTVTEDDPYEMPARHLVQLASFFGVEPVSLYKTEVPALYLDWVKCKKESLQNV